MITQVYEIQTREEAEAVALTGVHRIGSVLTSQKNRLDTTIRSAVDRVRELGCESSLIPLFSDTPSILEVIEYYQPDVIHFCESLMPFDHPEITCAHLIDIQKTVKSNFPDIQIMRSIPIPEPGSNLNVPTLALARLFEPVSDIFLTDTILSAGENIIEDAAQPVQGFVGITGKICNPDTARSLVEASGIPVMLAGGLSPDNVYELGVYVRPAGVDSCTQTNAVDPETNETVRFKKDIAKVTRFVNESMRICSTPN